MVDHRRWLVWHDHPAVAQPFLIKAFLCSKNASSASGWDGAAVECRGRGIHTTLPHNGRVSSLVALEGGLLPGERCGKMQRDDLVRLV